LHDEVAAFFGQLGTKVVPLRPGDRQAKGQVERTNGCLDRSFLSLRSRGVQKLDWPPDIGSGGSVRDNAAP